MLQRPLYCITILSFILFGCGAPKTVTETPIPQTVVETPVEEKISLADIWSTGKFSPQGVWGMNAMKDGQHFSRIERGRYPSIAKYNYKTGQKVSTILDGTMATTNFDSYTFSDDESKILLSTDTERIYRHSTKSNYVIFDTETGETMTLAEGAKQTYPAFSPDGKKVAYVQENNIYYKDLTTGTTHAVTTTGKWNDVIHGMGDWVYEEEFVLTRAYEWSPDSNQIAYFSFDENEVNMFRMDFYGDLYPSTYEFKYPKAGEVNSVISSHLYDLSANKTLDISTGDEEDIYFPRMKWTPGNDLVIFKMNRHQNELELHKVNQQTGSMTLNTSVFLKETNPYFVSEDVLDEMEFLPNGDFLWTSERSGFKHVYLYDADGTLKNQITDGEYDVTTLYGLDEENGKIFYQAAENSPLERQVYSINLDGTGKTLLTNEAGWSTAQFTDSFDYFIHRYSSTTQPTVIAVRDRTGKEVRTLEDNAGLKAEVDGLGLPTPEFFDFKTVDGTDLNGWMLKPENFDPNVAHPVLMFVYGGPGSQTVKNQWAASNYWWHTYLTQKGYIVVSVDNRGTGGRGQEFKKSTYQQLGKFEVEDQIAAAKYLGAQDYVDADRIGIWGWSYGGYMSSLALFKGNDVFKTAIAVAPVTNWRYYDTIYTERYMRTPQENPDGYDDNSPINYVDMLEGNYLLVHGMGDDNVHFQNTVDLISALNAAGKQYDLAVYPNKNHGIYGGNTRYHLFEKMTNFLLENL